MSKKSEKLSLTADQFHISEQGELVITADDVTTAIQNAVPDSGISEEGAASIHIGISISDEET